MMALLLALLGCGTDVDLRGPPREPAPAVAIVGAPASLDPDHVPQSGATAACIDDVCLVPALGLVSRRDGTLVSNPRVDGQVASDGARFLVAYGGELRAVGVDGAVTTIPGPACTHVAWTGARFIARCTSGMIRVEGDVALAGVTDPLTAAGATWLALVGTARGALAIGFFDGRDDLGSVVALALDHDGAPMGRLRELGRTAFASDARAVGMGGRVLVAWPAFAPFPRRVPHVTVLDAGGGELAAPEPLLAFAAPGSVATDGRAWLHAWTDSRDGSTRVLRVGADGSRLADFAGGEGSHLGYFDVVSVVGLDDGPYLVFSRTQLRVLRFLPVSDEPRR